MTALTGRRRRARWPSFRRAPSGPDLIDGELLDSLRRLGGNPVFACFPQGAIIVFDHDLRFMSVGGLALADVGLSRQALEGRTIFEAYSDDVVAIIEPLYRRALAGQETVMDVPYKGKIFLQRLGPLRDDAGRIVAGMGFTQDVSDARRAESRLRESESRFRLAFEHGPVAMALVEPSGGLEQVNPALCTLSGYPADALLTMRMADLLHPDDRIAGQAAMAELLAGNSSGYILDQRFVMADGASAWGTTSATLVRRDDGSPLHVITQINDITARKEFELDLIAERRRRQEAEGIGRSGLWHMDVDTGRFTWSEGLNRIWGLAPEIQGSSYVNATSLIVAEDAEKVHAALAACAADGTPIALRYRIARADDGVQRWINTVGEAIRENGRIVRVGGAIADITEQVLADIEVAEAAVFQRAVFTATPDIITVYEFASRTVVWQNRSILAMLGYDEPDIEPLVEDSGGAGPQLSAIARTLVIEQDRERLRLALLAAHQATDDRVHQVDCRVRDRSGAIHWLSYGFAPLNRDADGLVTRIVSVGRETTDAKRVEESLRESESRFRQLADSIDAAFLLHSWETDTYLYASPGVQRLFGVNPMDEQSSSGGGLQGVHPDDLDHFLQDYWLPTKAGVEASIEYRFIRPDGEVRWIRSKSAPVRDASVGGVVSASTSEDITASRQAEAALLAARTAEKANAAKNEFLSRMSHELRTPLNAVTGFAQLLELDDLTSDQSAAVRHILRGSRHLLGLINDVLDISKIDSDRLDLSLELVPAARLIAETVELMTPAATAANVTVIFRADSSADRPVRADHRRLRQVLLNLLSNSIKYNRPGGRVDVSAVLNRADCLDIMVTDTGRGIRAEHLSRLFTPFDRLDASTTGIEGTGVGLALSHRLMTLMGGTLTATSTFGSGSTFTARIPLEVSADQPAEPVGEPMTQPAGSEPLAPHVGPVRTLLYVEDNSSNVELMERIMARRTGWKLLVAGHGGLGLELAHTTAPDLILLDLHLPDMNGVDVLRQLQVDSNGHDLKIVVVSADANPRHVTRLLAAGARAYLTKPLEVNKVLELLDAP